MIDAPVPRDEPVRLAALREAEEHLRTVVATAPILVFALDDAGVITFAEGRGLESLGLRPGKVVGRCVFKRYRGMPQVLHNVRRALAGETVADTVDVGGLVFDARYIPMRDEDGRVTRVIGVATDITERMRAEAALRRAKSSSVPSSPAPRSASRWSMRTGGP